MLDAVIRPRTRDLGDGFQVRRALPAAERRSVGPFVFFDQMGPVALAPGKGLDVRPHPHIGLATVTYLFEGEILHRDSLGTVQPIRPGDVNWMTAGRGIAHSERTPPELRTRGSGIFGIQLWVGLPRADEEAEPAFVHADAAQLPMAGEGVRVILGEWRGARSPVPTLSRMFYADAALPQGASFELDFPYPERAVYVAAGTIDCAGRTFDAGQLLVFAGSESIEAKTEARVLLLGGEPLDGQRYIWWNFVSSRKERIAQAADDWQARRFAAIPGETEFIPLPGNGLRIVDYP
ncbi:MAG TPA: pirin family protein [Burkholderiales bacterium]|nr:pirin family protein [Burkholderiales bacterium]